MLSGHRQVDKGRLLEVTFLRSQKLHADFWLHTGQRLHHSRVDCVFAFLLLPAASTVRDACGGTHRAARGPYLWFASLTSGCGRKVAGPGLVPAEWE